MVTATLSNTYSYSCPFYAKFRLDTIPTINISDASIVEGNSGNSTLNFTISLSKASLYPVSLYASISSITASAQADYAFPGNLVTIPTGSVSVTYSINVLGDANYEPDEFLSVSISNPTYGLLGDSYAIGTIGNDDSIPGITLPNDTFFEYQWYLNVIDVFNVWKDYNGQGINVAVFDQGIDPNQPDLNGNLILNLGRNAIDLSVGGVPTQTSDNHGTMVAGTIGAERDGVGTVGVAYAANLIGIYSPLTFSSGPTDIPNAYNYASNFDVLNDSWGYGNAFLSGTDWAFYDNFLSGPYQASSVALANLAATGRSGLGTVVVQSAGNSFGYGDDTNLHNFQNSQFIITVAATDYFGDSSPFSTPGASILVAAPGGGGNSDYGSILTTDRVGSAGNSSSDYTYVDGTSFSAPIVSGIVALMLEANSNLGYRDVQEILAYSARETSNSYNTWEYNGATNWNGGGLHFDAIDHDLGFGLVDAKVAVRLAETWDGNVHTFANREQVTISKNVNQTIIDNNIAGIFDSVAVSQNINVERAEVTLHVTHPFIGDLAVLLISPSGVNSWLLWHPGSGALSAIGSTQNDINFTFDTVLDWGESSAGAWTLNVMDLESGDVGTFDSWTLNLIGKPDSADDTYIYTDEYSESCVNQSARANLTDTGGVDTLNAAAASSSCVINLASNSNSTIDGQNLFITNGTVIENAYGGDGNDLILGNEANNILAGMRGNDTLTGGAGNDVFKFSVKSNGVDTLNDFSVGDSIWINGLNLTGQVNSGNGAQIGAGQVQITTFGSKTTVYVGTDNTQGADFSFDLLGKFLPGQLTLANDLISINTEFINHAPALLIPLIDQTSLPSNPFNYHLSSDTFSEVDVGDTLSYSTVLEGGTSLPSWLSFDPINLIFSGTPTAIDAGTASIKLTATDSFGASVSDVFSLTVLPFQNSTSSNEVITGSDDIVDTVSYSNITKSVKVDLGKGTATGGGGNDTLTSIENVTGSTSNDQITGNTSDNVLDGGAGNDKLTGGDGDDSLSGGEGNDKLTGGAGNDTLDGGNGNDNLFGGANDDTYTINDARPNGKAADVVTEKANEGTDTVIASISYALTNNVENLTLLDGAGDINGTGNKGANTITGNDGNNLLKGMNGADSLSGGIGSDTLNGGTGNDTLSGEDGSDIFLFDTALTTKKINGVVTPTNVDTITDFVSGTDDILLKKSIFKAYKVAGDLTDNDFASFDSAAGETLLTAADSTSRHFLYDIGTGNLYYDMDGSGNKPAVQFATLTGTPTLAASDLHIV